MKAFPCHFPSVCCSVSIFISQSRYVNGGYFIIYSLYMYDQKIMAVNIKITRDKTIIQNSVAKRDRLFSPDICFVLSSSAIGLPPPLSLLLSLSKHAVR